jgi:hypothetical protein
MIYVIDNGEAYSNHTLYFVEAPDDFGAWFNEVYRPWVDGSETAPLMIMGRTSDLTWLPRLPFNYRPRSGAWGNVGKEKGGWDWKDFPLHEFSTIPVTKFLKSDDVKQERDGKPRPRYRLEVA